jgi:signal transduction histidine kinase
VIHWSLRGRMITACLTCFVAGVLLVWLGQAFFQDLWRSVTYREEVVWCDDNGFGCASFEPWSAGNQALAGLAVMAGVVVLYWLVRAAARRILRPLAEFADTVRLLGPQNLGQRIRHRGPHDEARGLADALDELLDRMATGYEGQRRFASNASHELRTPLAVQRTLVEVAMVTGEQDLPRLAAQLLAVNERNEQLIEGLLVLAESDRGLPGVAPVRLDVLVGEVLDRFADQATEHGVTVRRDMTPRTVAGDRVLLERLVSNLVSNAIKYNDPGGTVDVVVAAEPALLVHNTGQSVPAETVPALFEPFRRLTAERANQPGGAGLGLSIVRSIAAAHRGTVTASPGDSGGLKVRVDLP